MKPSRPFSDTTQEMLKDPELAALYLEECLEEGDMELFTAALKDVADAFWQWEGFVWFLEEASICFTQDKMNNL